MSELVYLDSSAIVKLVRVERETAALRASLGPGIAAVTSALARIEVHRAILRAEGTRADLDRLARILDALAIIAIDRPVVDQASRIAPAELRSLDAIHLATALSLDAPLDGFIAYDRGLQRAAAAAGLRVLHPG